MIASLRGILEVRDDPYLIIDVQGVGYKVLVSHEVLAKGVPVGEELKLFIYTYVREDALDLYGFLHREDLKLFELLIGVSGIGPKTAMSVFSVGTRFEIISAIIKSDTSFFVAVPRLGKKNAQKLIIELKSKLGSVQDLDLSDYDSSSDEVVAALTGFGYTVKEAQAAVRLLPKDGLSTTDKIKQALKYLGK